MVYRSVKSRLKKISEQTSLESSVKQQIRNRLEIEMAKEAAESSRSTRSHLPRKLPAMAAVVLPLAVIVGGIGYWASQGIHAPQKGVATANNTVFNNSTVNPSVPTKTKIPTLRVNVSSLTANGGALSTFLHGSTIHSHQFPGSSGTGALVLASVEGDGTLVAVNFNGDGYVTAPGYKSTLYFVSAKSNKVQVISKLSDGPSLGVVSSAVLSSQWAAWTDFIPNGVMQNVGILNRHTGKSSYVVSPKDEQQFQRKGLGTTLFLRGNTLYMLGFKSIQSYNIVTKKWSTFYTPPTEGNLQLSSFELTGQGAVVELSGGNFNSDVVVQLNQQGQQVGDMYHLPTGVYTLTGVSGHQVIFDGDRHSYTWTPGSPRIQEVTNVSGWFSGVGRRYLAGWDYSQQSSGQLLDMQTKTHYKFNASSAAVTSTTLYWTNGNTLYWAAVPNVPTSSFTPEQAIGKVNNIEGTVFPTKPETNKGTIYEIILGKKNPIPGTLQTKIKESGPNSYLVTFIESWSSKAFQVSSHNAIGEHSWTYLVTPASSKIVAQTGDYPPQAVK